MFYLSIVVPAYNVEKYIVRCLDSIFSQTVPHDIYETVVINDGSKDNTGILLQEYQSTHLSYNLRLFEQENAGLSQARNIGFKKAKGDYVWFVDADDWIEPNSIELILSHIKETNSDIITMRARTGDNGPERNVLPHFNKAKDLLKTNCWSPCVPFYVYKRLFLESEALTFYPGIYHEDLEFTPRVLFMATSISYIDIVLYNVVVNPCSIMRTFNPKKAFDYLLVADSLISFAHSQGMPKKGLLCDTLAILINNALSELSSSDNEVVNEFNMSLEMRHELLNNLKFARGIKYRIEYALFTLFRPKYYQVYSYLQFFNIHSNQINR